MDKVLESATVRDLAGLNELIIGKKGQLFLVIQHERVPHFIRSDSQESDYHFEKKCFMGLLSDELLAFREMLYGLPTESFAEVSLNKALELVPGPFLFPFGRGLHGQNTVTIGAESKLEFEAIIGDAAVLRYRPDGSSPRPSDPWGSALIYVARVLGKDLPDS